MLEPRTKRTQVVREDSGGKWTRDGWQSGSWGSLSWNGGWRARPWHPSRPTLDMNRACAFMCSFACTPFQIRLTLIRKIRAPIKIKSALPPTPPKTQKTPPPPNEEFYGHGFFLQKERIFPGVHKIGAPISGPRIADTRGFYGHEEIRLTLTLKINPPDNHFQAKS